MANYQIAWRASTRTVVIQAKGDALPANHTKIAEFVHGEPDNQEYSHLENHVFFHHVRDALYKQGVQDMQSVKITQDTVYKALTALSSTPPTVTLAVAGTQQITNAFTPSDASNQNVTYSSSNTAKATVNSTGLITAVQTGSATITVSSADGAFTDTVVVTIS